MENIKFNKFVNEVVHAMQIFSEHKEANLFYGKQFQDKQSYAIGETLLAPDEYIFMWRENNVYINVRFRENGEEDFQAIFDNGAVSLTLNQDADMISGFRNASLSQYIQRKINDKDSAQEKLSCCLTILSDFSQYVFSWLTSGLS